MIHNSSEISVVHAVVIHGLFSLWKHWAMILAFEECLQKSVPLKTLISHATVYLWNANCEDELYESCENPAMVMSVEGALSSPVTFCLAWFCHL